MTVNYSELRETLNDYAQRELDKLVESSGRCERSAVDTLLAKLSRRWAVHYDDVDEEQQQLIVIPARVHDHGSGRASVRFAEFGILDAEGMCLTDAKDRELSQFTLVKLPLLLGGDSGKGVKLTGWAQKLHRVFLWDTASVRDQRDLKSQGEDTCFLSGLFNGVICLTQESDG